MYEGFDYVIPILILYNFCKLSMHKIVPVIYSCFFFQICVSLRYPELTELGLKFLHSGSEETFDAYPEADMQNQKPNSTFSKWGRGWADPEIRRQHLQGKRFRPGKRKRRSRKQHQNLSTVRGRLVAKLTKKKC